MKKLIFLLFITVILIVVYYYFTINNNQISTTTYEYSKIEKGSIRKTISATGKIIPTSTQILSSEMHWTYKISIRNLLS